MPCIIAFMGDASLKGAVADRLELNPELDGAALARDFARAQLVHIPQLLTPLSAERLHHALVHETPWVLTHNIDGRRADVPNLSPEARLRLALLRRQRPVDGFAYFHDSHELSLNGESYARPGHRFAELVALLNAPAFIGFMRRVTGMDAIGFADARAMLFRQGDFLCPRDGAAQGANRLAGYVLSMTPFWSPDWGGVLQFVGASGHVEKGYVPTFNTLTVFGLPRLHLVSQVALYAGLHYSISGWLRSC